MTHINTHYLDAYSEWSVAVINAKSWYDVAKTHAKAVRTTNLMEEWVDVGKLNPCTALEYTLEMEEIIINKSKIFLN